MGKKDEKELLEAFRGMNPENKRHFLAYARVALDAQENGRKSPEKPKRERKARTAKVPA